MSRSLYLAGSRAMSANSMIAPHKSTILLRFYLIMLWKYPLLTALLFYWNCLILRKDELITLDYFVSMMDDFWTVGLDNEAGDARVHQWKFLGTHC